MTCKIIKGMQYKIIPPPGVTYEQAPTTNMDLDGVNIKIEDGNVEFTFEPPLESLEEARNKISSIVIKWRVSHGLEFNGEELGFQYVKDHIKDLCSVKGRVFGKNVSVGLTIINGVPTTNGVKIQVQRGSYSLPDKDINVTPEVKMLYERYRYCLQGGERLLGAGYFILDHFEQSGAKIEDGSTKRWAAAKAYTIEFDVLNELGRLTSMGDPTEARKSGKNGEYVKLNEAEKLWIKNALKLIIKRYAIIMTQPPILKSLQWMTYRRSEGV